MVKRENAGMSGTISFQVAGALARVELANPSKRNALDIAMWRELRRIFDALQAMPEAEAPRVVIVSGAGGQFASGGDIVEFAGFRFNELALRDFHENVVAPALHAMLACDIPVLAQIEGACVGGGFEIAACCDIRICGASSRFGAPIAKLGFPMAPAELAVLARITSGPVLREMLLEARLFGAERASQLGLVNAVVADVELAQHVLARAEAIAALSAPAARINKRSLRHLAHGGSSAAQHHEHFGYADSPDHREGIAAFIAKRPPNFSS